MANDQIDTETEAGAIEKPAPDQTLIIDISNKDGLSFAFDLDDVNIGLSDVDLIIEFPDGSKIILLEYGLLALTDSAPTLEFNQILHTGQELIAKVGEFSANEIVDGKTFSSLTEDTKTNSGEGEFNSVSEEETESEETTNASQAQDQNPDKTPEDLIDKKKGDSFVEEVKANDKISAEELTGRFNETASASAAPVEAGLDLLPDSEISIRVLGITEQEISVLNDGTTLIMGATHQSPADENPSYATMSADEVIVGTAGNDIIYADSPLLAPTGTSAVVLEVTVDIPFEGWTPQMMTVTGLPAGMSVLDGEVIGAGSLFELDEESPLTQNIQINFEIPDTGLPVDANGFYNLGSVAIEYILVNSLGGLGLSPRRPDIDPTGA